MTPLPSHPGKAAGASASTGFGVRTGQVYLDLRRRTLTFLDGVSRQLHHEGIPFTPADLETRTLLTLTGDPVSGADLPLIRAWREQRAIEASYIVPRERGPELQVSWFAAPIREPQGELIAVTATVRCGPPELDWHALAGLAHDLRTPLNAITLQVAVLQHLATANPDLAKVMDGIKSSAERALRVGQDLLSWLKGPGQRGRPAEPVWFPLEPLLADIAREQGLAARNKQLVLAADVSAATGWEVHSDRTRLGRILANLLVNAIRYTPRGRVEFTASWRQEGKERALAVGVVDTGMGITTEEQESIFQPFERGRAGKQGDSSGSGMGLAVVDRLVEELGVELEVYSEHGRGSAFHLLLPAAMLRPVAGNEQVTQVGKGDTRHDPPGPSGS